MTQDFPVSAEHSEAVQLSNHADGDYVLKRDWDAH